MGNSNTSEITLTPTNDFQRMLRSYKQLETDEARQDLLDKVKNLLNKSPELATTYFSQGDDEEESSGPIIEEVVDEPKSTSFLSSLIPFSSSKTQTVTEKDKKKGRKYSCLFAVCQMGAADLAKCLIDHGADVSEVIGGWTPLHFAVDANSAPTVAILLEAGADLLFNNNGKGKSPLICSARKGQLEVLQEFAKHGLNVATFKEENGWTLLMHTGENPEVTKYLIDQGVPLDDHDEKKGYAAIHIAAYNGFNESIGVLLEAGVDINDLSTKKQHTPLYAAVAGKEPEACDYLLEKGADPNMASISGKTPLHAAVKKESEQMMLSLLNKGADPNVSDKKGQTPLHMAVQRCELDLIKILLDKGADPNLTNTRGSTAYDEIEECSHESRKDKMRNIFRKAGYLDLNDTNTQIMNMLSTLMDEVKALREEVGRLQQ